MRVRVRVRARVRVRVRVSARRGDQMHSSARCFELPEVLRGTPIW